MTCSISPRRSRRYTAPPFPPSSSAPARGALFSLCREQRCCWAYSRGTPVGNKERPVMLRSSSTILYLAVFLGLLCYLTFIDKKMPGTKAHEDSENQLFKLNPDDVTSLEINNVHGLFIFKKDNNHWEIEKPVVTLADGPTVDGVISQIAFAQPQRI